MQAYLLTIEYQVVQLLQSVNTPEQFENIHVIHFFFFEVVVIDAWSRYFEELLSRLVCQLTIVPHTPLHDHLCHKTMKKYEDFEEMVIFLLPPRKFAIQNMVL